MREENYKSGKRRGERNCLWKMPTAISKKKKERKREMEGGGIAADHKNATFLRVIAPLPFLLPSLAASISRSRPLPPSQFPANREKQFTLLKLIRPLPPFSPLERNIFQGGRRRRRVKVRKKEIGVGEGTG